MQFQFMTAFSSTRDYDSKLRVFGKNGDSWGTYTEITHDGNNGIISTDTGDLELAPEGDVYIDGKLSWAVDTGYVSIPAAAFKGAYSWNSSRIHEWWYDAYGLFVTAIGVDTIFAPVQLPHNSRVVQVDAYILDSSTSFNGQLFLRRNNNNSTFTDMSIINSSGIDPSIRLFTDSSVGEGLIDNSQYSYFLSWRDDEADVSLSSVIIKYTFTRPY